MSSECDPNDQNPAILTISKFSPLAVIPVFAFAGYILALKSSKHMQPSKRAYAYFLISKFVSLVFLISGFAPAIQTPTWGFRTTGFLQIFDSLNPIWAVILPIFCHIIMLFFLIQVINTRCETIQRFTSNACNDEKKMLWMVSTLLKVLYFFILFSFWTLLLLLGFANSEDQTRLREAALKSKAKNVSCSFFFYMDTDSWRLYISIVVIVFLLITFLIFSIGYLAAAHHVLRESKQRLSKKVYKIQNGFLILIGIQVTLLFVFLLFLPVIFLAVKAPGSESISLTILFFIAHHGTASTIVFIFAHRFVRSKIINAFNRCAPKPYRVGTAVDADRLPSSAPQLQVFAVLTETTTL